MKPGDFKDIFVSRLLHFVQSVGLLNKWIQGLHKGSEMVDVHGALWCPPYLYSILFYFVTVFPPLFSLPYFTEKSRCANLQFLSRPSTFWEYILTQGGALLSWNIIKKSVFDIFSRKWIILDFLFC
jgi:hypothetical protein